MKFPKEYIKYGDFILHSGQHSNIFYDVNELMTNKYYFEKIIHSIPDGEHYVGIATGGAIIAGTIAFLKNKPFSMIKEGKFKGKKPSKPWILIDDVATTEKSLLEAISLSNDNPKQIFVVLDRRKDKKLNIISLFEPLFL